MRIKSFVLNITGRTYRLIFKEPMSPAVEDFVLNLSWVGAGTFSATGLLAVFSILGGRLLGPIEYGKLTLIQSVAAFLVIPMTLGFNTAMLKYLAGEKEIVQQKTIVSTTFMVVFGFVVCSAVTMYLLKEQLAELFSMSSKLFIYAIILAFFHAFYSLATTTLRSVSYMRAFAFFQPVHAIILIGGFFGFIIAGNNTYQAMLFPMFITYALTAMIIHTIYTRRFFHCVFDYYWIQQLSRFAFANSIGIAAVAFFGNIGKIIIARYLTTTDVGIFGAYFVATMSVATIIWGVFNLVFFPTVSMYKNKYPIYRRINRLIPLIILLGTPIIMVSGYIIFKLFGSEYHLNIIWLLLFSGAANAMVIMGFYTTLIVSEGQRGAMYNSIAMVVVALVSFMLNILLVPIIGIPGSGVAALLAFSIGASIIFMQLHIFFKGGA